MQTELLSVLPTDVYAVTGYRTVPLGYEATGSQHGCAAFSVTILPQCFVLFLAPRHFPQQALSLRVALDQSSHIVAASFGESMMSAVSRYVVSCKRYETRNQRIQVPPGERVDVAEFSERVSVIRYALSLNISQLASVFGVERRTVYQWLSGDVLPRTKHQRRVKWIYDIASEWERLAPSALGAELLQTPVVGEQSLLSLLKQDSLQSDLIESALKELVPLRVRLDEREIPWPKSALEIARDRGLVLPDDETRWRNVSSAVRDQRFRRGR